MGKKRERKGKRLFLYSACLLTIICLSAGCSATLTSQKKQGKTHLDMAERLFGKGDYAGALKEYEAAALLLPGNPPVDKALFSMGITWADPENPQRDYSKALGYFERLVSDFPQGALMNEARVLVAAIKEIILRDNRVTELEGTLAALQKEAAALKETDAKAGEKNKDLEETIRALKRQINSLKETGIETEAKNRDLEETVRTLKNQLNALKEIDLGIEGKKR